MTLLDFLKRAIADRGWTIPEFARRCGVSPQLAYKWLAEDEAARITPGPSSCEKIAEALGLDADYVLELAGHRKPRLVTATASRLDAAFFAELEAGANELDDESMIEYAKRIARAAFSLPSTGAKGHSNGSAKTRGRTLSSGSKPEGFASDSASTDCWRRVPSALALAHS